MLYGQYLALNHLMATKQLNVPKLEEFIDFPSYTNLTINDKLHIHVYHNDGIFSKFEFKKGDYDKLEIPTSNTDQIDKFCLKMALESKRLSDIDLLKLFEQQNLRKN